MAVRLSIPGKVFGAFAALLLTFGGVSVYTVSQVRDLGHRVARLHTTLLPLPSLVANLRGDVRGLDGALDPGEEASFRRTVYLSRNVHRHLARIGRGLDELEARLMEAEDGASDVLALAHDARALKLRQATLADQVNTFFDAVENGDAPKAPALSMRQGVRAQARDLASFEAALNHAVGRAVLAFGAEERRITWGVIVLATVAMFIGLLVAVGTSRLLRPLGALRAGVERFARGEYGQPLEIRAQGELGELGAALDRMAAGLRERDARLGAQQREILHQERLATVGRMSSQITHELRNPLSSIGLNSELLLESLDEPAPDMSDARGLLLSIINEVERLREITEEYLRFARLPRPERRPVDLSHASIELLEFLRAELDLAGARARVDSEVAARPAFVDPNQLRAALLNLIRNAREALEPKGGHIVVRVRTLGDEATLEVIDDGPGMSEEAMEHLFEPFFSTKPQGTGLGLSMVRQIAEVQGGQVEVESERGRGTTVRMRLPLAEAET